MQTYLSHCLDRHESQYYAIAAGEPWLDSYWRHLALGHAKLLIAKRGVGATLLKREADSVNREWESAVLSDRIQEAISFAADQGQ